MKPKEKGAESRHLRPTVRSPGCGRFLRPATSLCRRSRTAIFPCRSATPVRRPRPSGRKGRRGGWGRDGRRPRRGGGWGGGGRVRRRERHGRGGGRAADDRKSDV